MTDYNTYIKIFGIPSLPFVALVIVVIGGIILHKTKFGRYTYAIGSNEEAARRVGIKVDRHLIMIYGMTGLLAGFAASCPSPSSAPLPSPASRLTNLNVIAAVVIGGTSIFGGEGSIFGTVVGLVHPGRPAVRVRHHRRCSRSGRASPSAPSWSPPSTSTSPAGPPRCAARVRSTHFLPCSLGANERQIRESINFQSIRGDSGRCSAPGRLQQLPSRRRR